MNIFQQVRSLFASPSIEKAIGSGFTTVPTVLPPGYDFQSGTRFLNFLELEGLEDGPKRVVVRSAYLQNSWVYSAIQVMATNMAQAKWKIMKGEGEQAVEVLENSTSDGWVPKLFAYVSPTENRYSLWEGLLVWLAMSGECFWHLKRAVNGWPAEIDIVPPPQMEEVILNARLSGWKRNNGQSVETIPAEDVIQFKYFNPYNKWRGISPLTAAALGIHVDLASSLYNYFFFANDATPNLVISTDQEVDDEMSKTLRLRWLKQYGGVTKKGIPAFLGSGTKPVQLSLAQKDIQYIEQKKWSREEVFAVLNVPPALSQVLEFASIKSNIKEQRQQLFENNLIPKMKFIEDVTKTQFFDREKVAHLHGEFDTTEISALKETIQEKITSAQSLFNMSVPFNVINEKLGFGFDPLPWGDIGYLPLGYSPAGEPKPEKPPTNGKPPVDEDEEEEDEPKSVNVAVKKRVSPIRLAGRILETVGKQESKLRTELGEYFYKMRSDVLARVFGKKSVKQQMELGFADLLPDEDEYDMLIINIARPIYAEVVEIGLRGLNEAIGTNVSLASARANAIIQSKAIKLREINDTIREQIISDTRPIIQDAIKEGLSYQNVADRIADEVKNIFNNARRRTETVARTEINGTLSASRSAGMQEAGVEEIQWISTRMIRQIHIENHLKHRKYYVEKFPSGIYEPYDPDAGPENVINCSCVAVPYEFGE